MGTSDTPKGPRQPVIDQALLAILACPACHASVSETEGALVCGGCGRRYPIRDGIPIMLIQESVLPADGGAQGKSAAAGKPSPPPQGAGK
jgi:hypothetical protein